MLTIGTHNLHDQTGVPTFFADVIGFTEAIPVNIRARKRARWAKVKARLAGYTIRVCTHQRDLVVALRRRHYKVTATRYHGVHGGVAKVTPHRGTFVVETRRRVGKLRRAKGRREVFLLSHRINAAFPPYIRGEAEFRADCWGRHTATDDSLVADYLARGWVVHLMGDLNTPRGVRGTDLAFEVGHGFDRIASSEPLVAVEYLSRMGSDHPRLRALMDDRKA
jgi:hypothetical protein